MEQTTLELAQHYLDHFFKNLTRKTDRWQVFGIFLPCLDAYREGVRCFYESQAYEATAVMCRNSIDGCILLALSRVPVQRGRYNLDFRGSEAASFGMLALMSLEPFFIPDFASFIITVHFPIAVPVLGHEFDLR